MAMQAPDLRSRFRQLMGESESLLQRAVEPIVGWLLRRTGAVPQRREIQTSKAAKLAGTKIYGYHPTRRASGFKKDVRSRAFFHLHHRQDLFGAEPHPRSLGVQDALDAALRGLPR